MSIEVLRLRCRGHAAVRGTHAKTLEFSADADITARATCVIGVAAELVGPAEPAVAGPLRITIASGGVEIVVHATGNSLWRPASGAVVRLSSERLPDTLATNADLAASGLPRELIQRAAEPSAVVDVLVERAPGPPNGVLVRFRAGPGRVRRLAVECAAADLVIAEDGGARAAVTAHGGRVGRAAEAAACLAAGGRVLAVATTDDTEPTIAALLAAPDRPTVEVLGLPPELAVSAVSPQATPVLAAGRLAPREVPRLVGAHPGTAVVFTAQAAELPRVLAEVDRQAGARRVAVAGATPAGAERPWWGPAAEVRAPGRGDVVCRVDAEEESAPLPRVDPTSLVSALLADSVSPRTVAMALAAQPGWSRRGAYDFVLALTRRPSG
ncbi:hypothetical protein FHR81_001030 [Actinoalloteichus hoggarensis]|uniref:Uncharacterized protein n=1 Tax=Actinoalloteichus hoggarensis TaxID=1470176 RepID=A0A221VZ15_9PSEU|nr:DUF371 domain-containing protein [Actinoalloteichus hoggarensis]ASO18767.1 hypothetical protein AHOG_05570 [Actinoalloteichus hoggarensis]MBB5920000.1 hypothetical protein [Actinoalloteichus hoggarensis]